LRCHHQWQQILRSTGFTSWIPIKARFASRRLNGASTQADSIIC